MFKSFSLIKTLISFIVILSSIYLTSCQKNFNPEQKKYILDIMNQRKDKDDFMKNNPESPFNQDKNAVFHPLRYYGVDPSLVFKSRLYRYNIKDTIKIFGTKGDERKVVRFGYVKFVYKNNFYKLNVYEGTSKNGLIFYTIWFTDKTTGDETYGVGRYLDFDLNNDSNYVYNLDFNLAYSPYCSYSVKYSCAIPSKEDYIDLAIEAGEKKFH
ncbi:MAG: DUF1684 domain-containing protein [Ignavibacteriaceae bacterium]